MEVAYDREHCQQEQGGVGQVSSASPLVPALASAAEGAQPFTLRSGLCHHASPYWTQND